MHSSHVYYLYYWEILRLTVVTSPKHCHMIFSDVSPKTEEVCVSCSKAQSRTKPLQTGQTLKTLTGILYLSTVLSHHHRSEVTDSSSEWSFLWDRPVSETVPPSTVQHIISACITSEPLGPVHDELSSVWTGPVWFRTSQRERETVEGITDTELRGVTKSDPHIKMNSDNLWVVL